MKLKIVLAHTESPSLNVRVLANETPIFYNSTRLQGSERIKKLSTILGQSEFPIGETEIEVSQEQFNQIAELGSEVDT